MAISITKIKAAQVSFGSPYTITAATAAAGTTVLFVAGLNADSAQATATLTDSAGGNTYTLRKDQTSGGNNASILLFESVLATGLTASNHWTFTPQNDGQWNVLVYVISGATSTPDDQLLAGPFTNTASPASPSLTPGTQPVAGFAAFVATTAFSAYGNIIGNAATGLDNTTAMGGRILITEWLRLTAVTAGTATATIGAGGDGAALFGTWKESGGSVTQSLFEPSLLNGITTGGPFFSNPIG